MALPIFQPIIESIWADNIAPKEPLSGPSAEARGQLVDLPIDYMSGTPVRAGGHGDFIEHFRIGSDGQVADTQYDLVSREEAEQRRNEADTIGQPTSQTLGGLASSRAGASRPLRRQVSSHLGEATTPQPQPQPQARGLFAPWGNQGYQR